MREEERLRQRGGTPAGRTVIIDPGHGGPDRGVALPDIDEAEIVEDLAHRLEGRLGALGVTAYLTRGPDGCPDDASRAEFANETEADVLLSLHVDGAADPRCHGLATYSYGTPSTPGSRVGRRLADLIQRELVDRTDLLDCRTHPKTWDLLRLTQMPAVRVDLGYLTRPADAARLRASEFRDTAAEGLAAAVQRLYLPAELDPTTGQLQSPALSH